MAEGGEELRRRSRRSARRREGIGGRARWGRRFFAVGTECVFPAPEVPDALGIGIEGGTFFACFSAGSQFGSKEEDDLIGRNPADGFLEAFQILWIRQTNQIGVSTELCGSVEPASLAAHEQTAHL